MKIAPAKPVTSPARTAKVRTLPFSRNGARRLQTSRFALFVGCAAAIAVILAVDCLVPRGVSISALYVIPIILIQRAKSTALTVLTACCSGVFASIGIIVSPDIGMPANMVILDYSIIMVVIAATGLLGVLAARRAKQLQTMTKLLTLCAWTKQVKVHGRWTPIESYLRDELGISVTHGIADDCADRLLADAGIEFSDSNEGTVSGDLPRSAFGQSAA